MRSDGSFSSSFTRVMLLLLFGLAFIFIFPMVSSSHDPPRMPESANLSSIAKTYQAYNFNDGQTRRAFTAKPGDTVHDVALTFAREEGVNDAILYFVHGDPRGPTTIPKVVLTGNISAANATPNPDFMRATLGVVFVANIPLDADIITTPLAWTRGLRPDGTWSPDSPWKGQGGHVVFLDGHVEWFDHLKLNDPNGAYFYKYGTHTQTVDIREALPPGAVILSAEPHSPSNHAP